MKTNTGYETDLKMVVTWGELQKINTCVYNSYGFKTFGISASSQDTSFIYRLFVKTDKKLTKLNIIKLTEFIMGVVTCYRSY